jgi:hypothetical protein
MDSFVLIATVVDMVAVAGLAVVVWRSTRDWDVALAVQRASLESLRVDLAELVAEAERRAQALDDSLGIREERLRTLVADLERTEAPRRAPAPPRRNVDSAEARLVRELEVSFSRPETASRAGS